MKTLLTPRALALIGALTASAGFLVVQSSDDLRAAGFDGLLSWVFPVMLLLFCVVTGVTAKRSSSGGDPIAYLAVVAAIGPGFLGYLAMHASVSLAVTGRMVWWIAVSMVELISALMWLVMPIWLYEEWSERWPAASG